MASGDSDYLENKLLDHVLGNTAFTAPSPLFIALFTASPSDSGGGTEVTGGSYARLSVTNNTTNFPAASGGSKSNGVTFSYSPNPSAGWGTVVAVGIFDASTGGNLIKWGDLTTSKTINSGDPVSFPSGSLVFTQD